MKKLAYILILLAVVFVSCNDYETYGDKKEKERNAIAKFIADSSFTVISEEEFVKNGYKTDLGRREFVKLDKSGVYMQIVRKGCGEKIKDGESLSVICRFWEISVQDTSKITNTRMPFDLDVMNVSRNGSTYSATFIEGLMLSTYGSSVPEAWLVPLPYINIGRLVNPEDETARVKMIVPHSQGTTSNAKSNVKPYYYDITFQRGR